MKKPCASCGSTCFGSNLDEQGDWIRWCHGYSVSGLSCKVTWNAKDDAAYFEPEPHEYKQLQSLGTTPDRIGSDWLG